MDVRMQRELLAPGVEGEEGTGPGAEVAGIGGELEQGVARAVEAQIPEGSVVGRPQEREVVGNGEDEVMMRAPEQGGRLPRQPALHANERAARAVAVPAGVVPHADEVTVRAAGDVAAQRGRAAVEDGAVRGGDDGCHGPLSENATARRREDV